MTNNTTADTTASGAGEAFVEAWLVGNDESGPYVLRRKSAGWLYEVPLVRKSAIDTLRAQLEAAEAKLACCMGVGEGSGRLFVYGDHDSIKAAQAIVLRAEAAEADAASAVATSGHVRRLVGKLDQWNACLSYNRSYVGEPEGLFKATFRELAKAVDAIYPEPSPQIDPHAGVTIYTSEHPEGVPASELIAAHTKAVTP